MRLALIALCVALVGCTVNVDLKQTFTADNGASITSTVSPVTNVEPVTTATATLLPL